MFVDNCKYRVSSRIIVNTAEHYQNNWKYRELLEITKYRAIIVLQSIIKNDIAKVKAILNRVQDNVDFSDFCHPLCDCDHCEAIKQQQQNIDEDDSDPVTVYSRGEHGRTGLHHAARKGELYLE